jgi:hypothetical protein
MKLPVHITGDRGAISDLDVVSKTRPVHNELDGFLGAVRRCRLRGYL